VEVVGRSGDLEPNATDGLQYTFYSTFAKEPEVAIDFISISHYGSGLHQPSGSPLVGNFPGSDYVQRTPTQKSGVVELVAMRELAMRPAASLEVQEWSILTNEVNQRTYEPSALGTAWTAASTTAWMCEGVERIFHWQGGTSLRNVSGDGRLVNFYEQHAWNMAMLELFLGGQAKFSTYEIPLDGLPLNHSIATIESVVRGTYYALIAAVGADRSHPFQTTVPLHPRAELHGGRAQQYRMNASVSVVETVLRELSSKPGTLLHADGLPYDFGRLLTPQGFAYAQAPANLERYWRMHQATFQPSPFEGTWRKVPGGLDLQVTVIAPSVTVVVVD